MSLEFEVPNECHKATKSVKEIQCESICVQGSYKSVLRLFQGSSRVSIFSYKYLKCFKEISKLSKGFLRVFLMFKSFKGVTSVVCRIVHGC